MEHHKFEACDYCSDVSATAPWNVTQPPLRGGEGRREGEKGGIKERGRQFAAAWWESCSAFLRGGHFRPLNRSFRLCSCCRAPCENSSLEGQQHLHGGERKKRGVRGAVDADSISPARPNVSSAEPHAFCGGGGVCINACSAVHRLPCTPTLHMHEVRCGGRERERERTSARPHRQTASPAWYSGGSRLNGPFIGWSSQVATLNG